MLKSPDVIDRAIHRIRHAYPAMDPTRLDALEDALRIEFGGTTSRIAKRGDTERAAMRAEILRLWQSGQPLSEIARLLGVHSSTVHRALGNLRNQP